MDLNIGANRSVDESLVPENLKHLLPIIQRWAFEKPWDQDLFVKKMKLHHPEQVKAFSVVYDQNRDNIVQWTQSISITPLSEMPEDGWQHPVHAFVCLYKIRELTGSGIVSEEEVAAKKQWKEDKRRQEYAKATAAADKAFRSKDYTKYVEILSPFKDLLTHTQQKKIEIGLNRSTNLGH